MNINDDAWNTTTKELMLLGKIMEDENTRQAFYDCATKLHTLFHVARTYIDTGAQMPPYKVVCSCETPIELRE